MSKIRLTDWDCYLLQRAVLMRYSLLSQRAVDTAEQRGPLASKRQDLKRIYQEVHGLKHEVDWPTRIRQELIRSVHNLQGRDRSTEWVAGTAYNPHLYTILLKKLYGIKE